MEEAAAYAISTAAAATGDVGFSEATYLRDVIATFAWALGGLISLIAALVVWIYLGREKNASDERMRLRDAIDGVKHTLFEEGQIVRDYFHDHDKRLSRLEDFTGLYDPQRGVSRGRRYGDRERVDERAERAKREAEK